MVDLQDPQEESDQQSVRSFELDFPAFILQRDSVLFGAIAMTCLRRHMRVSSIWQWGEDGVAFH